ncbi:MAG: poly-beta-hydroxybutyrate polymerase, partial [Pseudomonadota bacterium]
KMHSEYLRSMYLNNDLSAGRFKVDGRVASISDIKVPIFAVGTRRDHVAPWQSVYKLHLLADTDITFILTRGGHNAGIVSEPGHKGRSFQKMTYTHGTPYFSPQQWREVAEETAGSWWPEWSQWLKTLSGTHIPASDREPSLISIKGNLLDKMIEAPGTYVFQH